MILQHFLFFFIKRSGKILHLPQFPNLGGPEHDGQTNVEDNYHTFISILTPSLPQGPGRDERIDELVTPGVV